MCSNLPRDHPSAFAHLKAGTEITPSMVPSVSQHAGQQLLTGQQAEAYADHFIAVHIQNMTGGKTYSQLSAQAQAQPDNAKLAAQVGFARIRRERPGALVFAPPAIEQIEETGHEAGASA